MKILKFPISSIMDEKQLHTQAIKVIGGHKSQITRALVTLERVIADGTILEADRSKVKSAKNMVEKQCAKIESVVDSMLANEHFTQEDLDGVTDYILEKGNVVEQVAGLLDPKSDAGGDGSVLDATSIGAAFNQSLLQAQACHLSQSDLPTFNGEESEFIPFLESFNYLVHENPNIPDGMKANHLKHCMKEKGPTGNVNSAYELLKYISPTAENYKLMRDKLEKRFKLGYTSKSVYITKLRKLNTWKPCHSATELRKLYDYITENLELLKLAGGSEMKESDILLGDVLSLVPNFIVNDFLKLAEKDRSLTHLLNDIDQSVSRMFEKEKLVPKQNKPVTNKPVNNNQNRGSYYNSGNNTNNGKPYYAYQAVNATKCIFCEGPHSSHNCVVGSLHDRMSKAQGQWLCHNCLCTGHFSGECRQDRYCKCGGGRAHCTALCFRNKQENPTVENKQGNNTPQSGYNNRGRGNGNNRGNRGNSRGRGRGGSSNGGYLALPADPDTSNNALADAECFMEIACGYVKSATTNEDVKVRFLLDSGSNASFGERARVKELTGEKVGVRSVNVSTLGGNMVEGQDCDIVKLLVKDRKNYYPPTEICISVLDLGKKMVQNVQTWPLTEQQAQRIRRYELSDEQQTSGNILPIDILIGLDHYWKFMHRRAEDPGFGPVLRSSKLGWILSGQRDHTNPRLLTSYNCNSLNYCVQTVFANSFSFPTYMSEKLENETVLFSSKSSEPESSDEEEYNALFSDLETFGIKPDQEVSPILEDFNSSVVFNEDTQRFKVRLPIITKFLPKLENGYQQSKVRLDSLRAKMRKPEHANFAKKYSTIIKDQERNCIIERVHDMSQGTNACYIPHHGVTKKGSDKLRIVYDGSYATSAGKVHLNDCLNPGPSLTNQLIEMLMRWRIPDVALTGDIEGAFLCIEVDEADRDFLRFLWYDENGELVVYRFTRVPFGLTSSSFLLNATLRYHMEKKCHEEGNPELLALLLKSTYVDDWILGAKSPGDVLLLKRWLTGFLEAVGMKLHKFNSNSKEVRQEIASECPEVESILGIPWNVSTDTISVNIEKALQGISKVATKKELYSAPPRVYDPLGFLAPFMFQAKLLFQKTCKLKLKWRDELPTNIREEFDRWRNQLYKLTEIKLPRQVLLPNFDVVELHGFGDASKLGYCACVYMVSRNSTMSISRLVVCKTRVAPLKEMSIPRLELTAAFLLARVMAMVIKFHDPLDFHKRVYYSDSTVTLQWIKSDHKLYVPYVGNRTRDVNLLSSPDEWKYVKTDQNPADLGSRGCDADQLVNNKLYAEGPGFLVTGRVDFDIPDLSVPTPEALVERRKMVNVVIDQTSSVEKILPHRKNGKARKLTDYSNINTVFNITGYLYQFIYMKLGADRFAKWLGYATSCEDGSFKWIAEERWIREVQQEYYEDEIKFCRDSPKVIPSGMKVASSRVQQLRLFLDKHGVLRVNTLLHNAEIAQSAKEPMLVPKHSYLASLIGWRAHLKHLKHAGVDVMIAEIQQVYWIPQCRQFARNIKRQCVKCRMMDAGTYPVLAPSQLPDFRVKRVEVFSNTGVDFAGPMHISTVSGIQRKSRKKQQVKPKRKEESTERLVYLVIFTCAVSRNVHSEVLDGMMVEDFMHGLRRFVSRYGTPALFYSDNAKTFQCLARELQLIFAHPNLQKFLNDRKITWKFNVQKSPWMGGFIERVVSLYKSSLARVIGRAKLDYQEFVTLVCELNGMLNSRPISYVYDTVGEEEPITPSRLWCGRNITMFPPCYEARIDGHDPQICNKRLKYLDKMLTHIWNRFTPAYIQSLSERHLSRNLPQNGRQPKIGEVVLVKNDKLPRGRWKIARVANVTPGPDGVVRRVELKLPHTEGNSPDELYRPPRLLVPLECEVDSS